MIFYILAISIMLYGIINYKKAFFCFLFFKSILVQNITFLSLPGLPLLKVDTCMTLFFILLFLFNRKRYVNKRHEPFPFQKVFVLLSASWFLSTVFSIAGFKDAISMFVDNLSQLILVAMIWIFIQNESDAKNIIKGFSILFFLYAIYMFFEYSIQANPLGEYEYTLVSEDRALKVGYDISEERGYRCQSVFGHAIGGGINFAMFGVFLFSLLRTCRVGFSSRKFFVIVGILCCTCVFLTGSRGPMLFLIIAMLTFVDLKNPRMWKIAIPVIILLFVLTPYLPNTIKNILYSIFDSSYQEKVGGSNADMRMEQLGAAWIIMQNSPFVGLGYKFLNVMDTRTTSMLLGMESMWFEILTTFGMLGVLVNLYAAYYFLIKLPKQYQSREIFFLTLAYWVTASLTSVPGILMYLYYLIIILHIKKIKWKNF